MSREEPIGFGEYIKTLRLSKHISLTRAAKRMNMTTQRLCDIESGRRFAKSVPLDFVANVSKAYGVSLVEVAQAAENAMRTEKTVAELVTEIVPTLRMAEMLAQQMVEQSKTYPPAMEKLAENILTRVGEAKTLFSAIRKQIVTEDKEPLLGEG